MSKKTRQVIKLIFQIIEDKTPFIFWTIVRLLSAFFPLVTIYLFSKIINLIEVKADLSSVLFTVLTVFIVRIVDNFTRIKSITRLDACIVNITFNIQNFFIKDIKADSKIDRLESIQAIRNFSDSTAWTLRLFRQPGIDSVISLVSIPIILFVVDFKVFILVLSYIIIYYFIDHYTTQRYINLKDIQNTKTEVYYGKLQETNDVDLEQKTFSRHFSRLINWSFAEWFTLQNTAVFFYTLIFVYLIVSISNGSKLISDLVLIMSYVNATQVNLNSFSEIKDSLADTSVAVNHLAENKSITAITFDDLT